jgi:basic amino acid/polyamine antiporter, APA family
VGVLRTKSIEQSVREADEGEHRLRRSLGALDLTVFGVGVIIGTGIFVLTGIAAATQAGPAVVLSFVLSGVTCALAALCYAELASTIPVAGSAYTFSYTAFGELVAWLIGWDLVLELTLGAATVAKGWSGYVAQGLAAAGVELPAAIAGDAARVDLLAALIVVILTLVLVAGIRLSSRANGILTGIKLAVVLLFLAIGAANLTPANWRPFIPDPAPAPRAAGALETGTPLWQALTGVEPLAYGVPGILFAAAVVFFAYIGFDVVATTAEEARNPRRDVPIGILGSLAICTALYVAVSLVLTGLVRYTELNVAAPMAKAFRDIGLEWAAGLVSLGAVAGLTTVTMVLLLGQSRVLFAMGRDRLLPPALARAHPRFKTPMLATVVAGAATAVLAALLPLRLLAEMVNIGTLSAFVLVSVGVLVLRRTRPDLPRAFRTPFVSVVPILAALLCLLLMLNLAYQTWYRFLGWMVIGLVVYAAYGYRRSRLAVRAATPPPSPRPAAPRSPS